MPVMFSERIKRIGAMVPKCETVADIGCDHAYTLIHLISKGICQRGIGCDIKAGPLVRARENIRNSGLSDRIELRQGDGLTPVRRGEASTVVISGMGGLLINEILNDNIDNALTCETLVLSPQRDVREVRVNLHKAGFRIADEDMISERGKFYSFIKAEVGAESYERDAEYRFGKALIDGKSVVLREFVLACLEKKRKIAHKIGERDCSRLNEVNGDIEMLERVLEEIL